MLFINVDSPIPTPLELERFGTAPEGPPIWVVEQTSPEARRDIVSVLSMRSSSKEVGSAISTTEGLSEVGDVEDDGMKVPKEKE